VSAPVRQTLITGLFNLTRREPAFVRRTPAYYFQHGEFLFRLDQDVMFFVEPEFEAEIARRRGAHGLLHRTAVIPVSLEDLPAWSLVPPIRDALSRNPAVHHDPGRDIPPYIAILWSRFDLLERAQALDPFGATHFAWIDMGIAHIARTDHCVEDGVFHQPSSRARVLMRRNVSPRDIADRKAYYMNTRGRLAAGYISVPRAMLHKVCDAFRTEALGALSLGIAHRVEAVLSASAAQHPDLFEFHYGNYDHILENYVRIRGSAEWLLELMRACREQGDLARWHDIGERILASHRDGTFVATPDVLAAIMEESLMLRAASRGSHA
jgi:hypothetical protein